MDNIKASNKIFSIEDAKKLSKKRLPKLVYDFIDGASGDEKLSEINSFALDQIRLEPRVLRNVEERKLKKIGKNKNIILIFKFSCWSSIRICLCLKPYIFISRLISMPS